MHVSRARFILCIHTNENICPILYHHPPGSVAVPYWYGEVTSYAEDGSGTGTSTNPSQSIDQFTQVNFPRDLFEYNALRFSPPSRS